MEVIAFVRILRRRRIAIAIGAVLAVALGITVGKSPVPNSGLAKTEVIVDTASVAAHSQRPTRGRDPFLAGDSDRDAPYGLIKPLHK